MGTLANVVTSLASLNESLNNGDTPEVQQEDQSASEITRYAPCLRNINGVSVDRCIGEPA